MIKNLKEKPAIRAPLAVKILIPITGVLFAPAAYLRAAVSTGLIEGTVSYLESEEIILAFIILTVAVFSKNKPGLFGGGLIVLSVFDSLMNGGRLIIILWLSARGRNSSVSFPFLILPLILRVLAFAALFVASFHFTARGEGINAGAKNTLSAVWTALFFSFCILDAVGAARNLDGSPPHIKLLLIANVLGFISAALLGACVGAYSVKTESDFSIK